MGGGRKIFSRKVGGEGKLGGAILLLFNWDSLLARLNSHYKTWGGTRKRSTKISTGNLFGKNLQLIGVC